MSKDLPKFQVGDVIYGGGYALTGSNIVYGVRKKDLGGWEYRLKYTYGGREEWVDTGDITADKEEARTGYRST